MPFFVISKLKYNSVKGPKIRINKKKMTFEKKISSCHTLSPFFFNWIAQFFRRAKILVDDGKREMNEVAF